LLLAILAVLTIALLLSPLGGRLAARLSVGAVIALANVSDRCRVVAASPVHEGVVPVQMTYRGATSTSSPESRV
jgi:hypothetical protein